MGLTIEDGTGSGSLAKVTSENRLLAKAVSEGPLEDASSQGNAAFFYTTFTASTGDTIISIKNTESIEILHITRILFASDANARFEIFEVTSGDAGGTTLIYQNPNLNSGTQKSGTFFGNAAVTGPLTGDVLFSICVPSANQVNVFLEASIQLSNNNEMAINVIGSNPTIFVTVIGFWHDDSI